MKPINITHIYPVEMNIYGDNGNVLVLQQRLKWRNIAVKIFNCGVGDLIPEDTHLMLGGGGQDAGQSLVADDLANKALELHNLAKSGMPMLMICGMYQMLGHYFKTKTGEKIPGIGVLDVYTKAAEGRLIGNILSNTNWGDIVGYENHSGRTFLGPQSKSFGITKSKQGNNGEDKSEGAIQNNVFGTYLHGPILAKSPQFADFLLETAIKYSGYDYRLEKLDDNIELFAAKVAKTRPR